MLNEYHCWLQERIAARPEQIALNAVYAEKGGEVSAQAAEEFRQGIKRLLGFSPAVYDADGAGSG